MVQTGNMKRAPQNICMSQTALGMQMKQLQESLGVPLLTRRS
jgi:DNA-binding transcriptional LysR family regulator